ncbi:cation:proton antiporter [Yinghuangia seranimata]|uniref:cation:proton antiporter n=1 Tax=Yinghuangia seranimata TaxID=408067 RepID=UPI00248C583B|nr:cation:proton antiporter [Yinghuangia seranimata]MDI2127514.1 cation:proton antiporter [Yinghuangia seranimata]
MSSIESLVVVVVMVALAPIVTAGLGRWVRVPTVVVEILLGVLAGPAVFAWLTTDDQLTTELSNFGLVMLMFLAGYEVDVPRIKGDPLRGATVGWFASLALGLGAGMAVGYPAGGTMTALSVGLALTTTALGTILPIVRDSGILPTRMGGQIMAIGTVGEFAPIVAIALLLSGRHPGATVVALAVFAVLAGACLWLAVKPNPRWLDRLVVRTLHSSGQLAVRLALLLTILLVWFADELELDNLLGAFTAGLAMRLSLNDAPRDLVETISAKLDAIGFGLFVPVFFVMSGVRFDLQALLDRPVLFGFIPLFLVLFLVVRGVPTYLLTRRGAVAPYAKELALFASTGLPLVVVITNIAVDNGYLKSSSAAVLVGAGMLSVLVFPQLALRGRTSRPEDFGAADDLPPGDDEEQVLKGR